MSNPMPSSSNLPAPAPAPAPPPPSITTAHPVPKNVTPVIAIPQIDLPVRARDRLLRRVDGAVTEVDDTGDPAPASW